VEFLAEWHPGRSPVNWPWPLVPSKEISLPCPGREPCGWAQHQHYDCQPYLSGRADPYAVRGGLGSHGLGSWLFVSEFMEHGGFDGRHSQRGRLLPVVAGVVGDRGGEVRAEVDMDGGPDCLGGPAMPAGG